MTSLLALTGRMIRGVIGLSPRSLAVHFESKPRSYLWLHFERKEIGYAVAEELPIPPDPRGSPFGGLEEPIRGLIVNSVDVSPGEAFTFRLGSDGGATHTLAATTDESRANLILQTTDGGTVLWAFHRAPETGGPAPGRPVHRPRTLEASTPEEIAQLREKIHAAFEVDFRRMVDRTLNAAGRALRRRVEAQGGDLERARAQVGSRRWGEILLAHYGEIPRGASRVRLPNTFADSPGATVEIPLDPSLTPHENAARLFQLAKKGERGVSLVEARLAKTRADLAALDGLRSDRALSSPKETLLKLGEFLSRGGLDFLTRGDTRTIRLGRQTAGAPRAPRPGHRSPGARESIRPRTYVVTGGWEVWVGRNNADNDRITHRLSNPHDYWFHVVGVPGSHVILRRPTRNAVPKPKTLEEAAAIAAYFSKARKLSRVPVLYTERKFVSKPRRGKPGQAICTRERELLVRPRIPQANAGQENEREVSG
jgi:hypothetical protein